MAMKAGWFSHLLSAVAAVLVAAEPAAFSQSTATAASTDELAQLRAENAKLRSENQRLRQLLVQTASSSSLPAPASSSPARESAASSAASQSSAASTDPQALTYWLSATSNKRHNASCRWFKASKGRACTATEGTPCKTCGG
jgi:hypothetical protein